MSAQTAPPLTQLAFTDEDHAHAERLALRLGYTQTAYTSTSALWGLFCLPDGPRERKGCIIKTQELGFLFVQCWEDITGEVEPPPTFHGRERAHIGDVMVHAGEPDGDNPYHGHSLIGQVRRDALAAFKHGRDTGAMTFWYAPTCGGARRITAAEVDWESSGVR